MRRDSGRVGEVLLVALRLGLTSFGGPIAHLGYFRAEYVQRRRWLDEDAYAELVAVSQLLPGPASSQVGAAVGYVRAGWRGALAAWVGFTLPSALALAAFAALAPDAGAVDAGWLRALKVVAVAVVLDAVIGMATRLAVTPRTAAVAVATFAAVVLAPAAWVQAACIVAAGVAGLWLFRGEQAAGDGGLPAAVSRRFGMAALAALALLLAVLPVAASAGALADLADAMFRAGALVFGGGHVVLPLLAAETVPGLVSEAQFLAGYGAAQAVPGPLFTFATYLGMVAAGPAGALVATVAVFLPGFLVLFGVLPFWARLRGDTRVRSALVAVNAAVVGVLAAALYDPVATTALTGPREVALAAVLFVALRGWRVPAWAVVAGALLAGPLLG